MKKTKFSWPRWAVCLYVSSALAVAAQSGLPPLPVTSSADLNTWLLEVPPWKSTHGNPARNFTNLNIAPSWDYEGTALSIGTNAPAFLQLDVIESNRTNITLGGSGSLEIWCQPNWTSRADGGSGPAGWATVWDIGSYTRNASIGAWLLTLDPPGSNLIWVAQSGGSAVSGISQRSSFSHCWT